MVTPSLSPGAIPFQKAVWDILPVIPVEQTMTYTEIAQKTAAQ
ncbi:MAG: hypothetical protein HFI15_16410 [Lachnospiraceae bacterium]|nr:hypothetical protein [Lachnospiraceae bacterium]